MCMPELDEDVSIHDAMHSGYEDTQAQGNKGGANGDQPPKPAEGNPPPAKPGEPDAKGDGSPDSGSPPPAPDDKKPVDPNAPPGDPAGDKPPKTDPDNGVYEGPYDKPRFNGLMSQWQKDRTEMLRLQQEEQKWKQNSGNPPAPTQPTGAAPAPINDADIIIPPELKNASPEEQEGFRVMMRSVLTAQRASLEQTQQKMIDQVLGKVDDKLTEPERQKNEIVTKILREVQDLTAEFGETFTKEKDAVMDWIKNEENVKQYDYKLGDLRRAYGDYKRDKAHKAEIARLTGGKKDVEDFEKDKKGQGNIPSPGAPRTGVIPKFDEEKDGDKSLSELMKEGYNA